MSRTGSGVACDNLSKAVVAVAISAFEDVRVSSNAKQQQAESSE